MKTAQEIRDTFMDFWKERNHAIIPNASLVPVNDPTLLFVNSGMFPLVPYLLGEKHPEGKRLANFQKSIRVQDIEDVGDNRHTTFFEMMGNWSLGDYFKSEQIPNFLELYHKYFGLDINRLYVSVFEGDSDAPLDQESIEAWQKAFKKYDINAKVGETPADVYKNFDENGKLIDPKNVFKIFKFPKKENWWDRGTKAPGEPGGPDSEMFYDLGAQKAQYVDEEPGINSDNGRFVEIGNSVFMEFKLNNDLKWEKLAQQNVDFGGGFERVVMCVQGKNDVYSIDIFDGVRTALEEITGLKYNSDPEDENTKYFRIIMDHIRGSVFILAENVTPGNKDQGYVLRRLIRRIVRQGRYLGLNENFTARLAEKVIDAYKEGHPHLFENKQFVMTEIDREETKFRNTIEKGLKEFKKVLDKGENIDGQKIFWMYETYGFPIEMVLEEMELNKGKLSKEDKAALLKDFENAKESHQSKSRAGAEQKFKGGLADQSEQTTRLHTAHHLLLAALRTVLGSHVHQKGSNITAERLRIDFSHDAKLSEAEVSQVEEIVNSIVDKNYKVMKKVLPREVAEQLGAEMEFGAKYGDLVNVYMIVEPDLNDDAWPIPNSKVFSKEFCGGPHVASTGELAKSGRFKILKQENVGAGVKRIKATLS
jgi:alanyl-tRNA synthetase